MFFRSLMMLSCAAALSACGTYTYADQPMRVAYDEDGTAVPEDTDGALICKTKSVPGSIIKNRICMTRQEWADVKRDSGDATKAVQQQALTGCLVEGQC